VTTTKKREVTTVTETTEKVYKDYMTFDIKPITISLGDYGDLTITKFSKGPEGASIGFIMHIKKAISFISTTDINGKVMPAGENLRRLADWKMYYTLNPDKKGEKYQEIGSYIDFFTTDFAALSTVTIKYQFEGEPESAFTINLPV
jgi:hypothetical protein